jgi:alpha-tubulin suppressor-like RCC1 family protein
VLAVLLMSACDVSEDLDAYCATPHPGCALVGDGGVHDGGVDASLPFDAGTPDAGPIDAGAVDAGALDAGAGDGGAPVDGGVADAGGGDVDGGAIDAGALDAGSAVDAGADGTGARFISAGLTHACAVLGDGGVRCWGSNANGECGVLASPSQPSPISAITGAHVSMMTSRGSCAVDPTQIWCWGYDVGTGSSGPTPAALTLVQATAVAKLTGGSDHTCALSPSGTVTCWGLNISGQLGVSGSPSSPVQLTLTNVVDLSAGYGHTCAVFGDGGVSCWGDNGLRQLGDGTMTSRSQPTPVTALSASTTAVATQVSAGTTRTCARMSDRSARCWGYDRFGILGTSLFDSVVQNLPAISSIASGDSFSCALLTTQQVRCWGADKAGTLLGDGGVFDVGLAGVVQVVTGSEFACALMNDGGVSCWGQNADGQIGTGSTGGSVTSPQHVNGL